MENPLKNLGTKQKVYKASPHPEAATETPKAENEDPLPKQTKEKQTNWQRTKPHT